MSKNYITDSPITEQQSDRFNRWTFAKRVVQTIVSRSDQSSTVIGIYGAWGEGKTTTLNFMKKEMQENYSGQTICISFNPWKFADESQLVQDFFKTIKDALTKNKKFKEDKKQIGELFGKYGNGLTFMVTALSLITANPALATVLAATASTAEFSKKIKDSLSTSSVDLEEVKEKIEKLLIKSKIRIVLLIDDIDRLDKKEIQAIFKLIKLSADFPYTTYVIAFDEEMVAAALGEKYSSGDKDSGRSFLEKIIQVPLHLPVASRELLYKFCIECVNEAIDDSKVKLSKEQAKTFSEQFSTGFIMGLKNPRMIKRYGQAIAFSLPILEGEVNPSDLMIIEAIRIFYPRLYKTIRENSEIFPEPQLWRVGSLGSAERDEYRKKMEDTIMKALDGIKSLEIEGIKRLLLKLFPLIDNAFNPNSLERDKATEWREERRIASKDYFSRFFTYSIQDDDISDKFFDDFLEIIQKQPIDSASNLINKFISSQSSSIFIYMLNLRINKLTPSGASIISIAMAKTGAFQGYDSLLGYSQEALTVQSLLKRISVEDVRFETAKRIIEEGETLAFALQCFNCIRREDDDRGYILISAEQEKILANSLVERIRNYILNLSSPIYIETPSIASDYLNTWAGWGNKEEAENYLWSSLAQSKYQLMNLLKCYMKPQWEVRSAVRPAKNGEYWVAGGYLQLVNILDADKIYMSLKELYSPELDSSEYRAKRIDKSSDDDEQIALQFAHIYNYLKANWKKKNNQEGSE